MSIWDQRKFFFAVCQINFNFIKHPVWILRFSQSLTELCSRIVGSRKGRKTIRIFLEFYSAAFVPEKGNSEQRNLLEFVEFAVKASCWSPKRSISILSFFVYLFLQQNNKKKTREQNRITKQKKKDRRAPYLPILTCQLAIEYNR